jgi:hypothetical protein
VHELTNPDIVLDDGGALPLQSLQIRIERRLTGPRSLEERIHVRSYHREELRLEFELDADFEPMFALRGIVERPAPREIERRATGERVRFSAVSRDDIERSTQVTASPSHEPGADAPTLRFPLTIPPAGATAAAGRGIATGDRRCGLRAFHQPAASWARDADSAPARPRGCCARPRPALGGGGVDRPGVHRRAWTARPSGRSRARASEWDT